MKKLFALALFLLILPSASAAKIHGNIYDLDFTLVKDTVVSIESEPTQKIISKDGSYSFDVSPGVYYLTAKHYVDNILAESTEESIEIPVEGDYVLDLILFPSAEDEEFLYILENESYNVDEVVNPEKDSSSSWLFIILVLVIIAVALLLWKPKKKKPEAIDFGQNEADKILEFIQKEGGTTTQKNIRKAFSMSEAKVSILVAELVYRNKVEKIKKGRGNIIILNRN